MLRPKAIGIVTYKSIKNDCSTFFLTSFLSPLTKLAVIFGTRLVISPVDIARTTLFNLFPVVLITPIMLSASLVLKPIFVSVLIIVVISI